ncbi:MAG: hypothetical protein M3Z54_09495 [Gemmatimonadota bacterium]|nr:hypothetical protein [Gemmatimonadota bacterium]
MCYRRRRRYSADFELGAIESPLSATSMTSSAVRVNEMVATFVAGGTYMALWRAIMDSLDTIDPEKELSEADQIRYQELYDLVYMGAPDPVMPQDQVVGLIGEGELRERLRDFRLDGDVSPPPV